MTQQQRTSGMGTDQWVRLLAEGAGPAPRHLVAGRVGAALAVGLLASALACGLTLGVNPGLSAMGTDLAVKLAYVLGVLAASAWWLGRLARPGALWHRAAAALGAVVALMAVWAGATLGQAPDEARPLLVFGHSWLSCPWRVAALSLPALAMAVWALRGLAPTRPRLAGFVAGLFSGSVGAAGYALFCTEMSPAFVVAWYSLGMLIPAAAGALCGPRVLRW